MPTFLGLAQQLNRPVGVGLDQLAAPPISVTGNGTGSLTLTGPLNSLNADLASLTYAPALGYNGSDTLALSDLDLVDTLTGSATVSFTIQTSTGNVLFSDSFNRPDATEDNLGQADNSLGGTGTYYYVPIFAGAVIRSGTLQSNSVYDGGVEFSNDTVTAFTAEPGSFDATKSHTLEVAFQGNGLQVALDDVLQTFNVGGTTVAIPATGLPGDSTLPRDVSAGNDGGAGLAFGNPPSATGAAGAEASNLVVTSYNSIADLPTDLNAPESTVSALPATTATTSFTLTWNGSPGPGATSISAR